MAIERVCFRWVKAKREAHVAFISVLGLEESFDFLSVSFSFGLESMSMAMKRWWPSFSSAVLEEEPLLIIAAVMMK